MDELNNQNVKIINNATRDDVRPGDHLTWARTTEYSGGVTVTERREGIAHERDWDGDWLTKGGLWITDGEGEGITLTIRPVQELPTEDGADIVPAEGHEYITATIGRRTYRAREAMLAGDRWHAVWRTADGRQVRYSVRSRYINPGTWKVEGK